ISGSMTLQELWRTPSNTLIIYYTVGNDLFDQKKYLEAHHVFSFLTLMNQNIPCFWIGKGATNEALENWDPALSDYWMAQTLNPENVNIYESLIRIYNKLQDKASLEECFNIIEAYPEIKKQLLMEGE
ncbi:MAG: hypothetical protein LLG04_16035, partial [Parachlamydia sp.]|nr:hypothetical protein [Parachlamydia sp.]